MSFTATPDIAAFVQSLPKTETHLHIEGALPWDLLVDAFPGRYTRPPESWHDDYRFRDFTEFMDHYVHYCAEFYVSPQRYHDAARIVFARCYEQNVRYVETSFHLPVAAAIGCPGTEIIEAIRTAAPAGMEVRVFTGMCHNDYDGPSRSWIDAAPEWEGLSGLDLHGPEDLPVEPWTARIWEKARAAGKRNKAHAGEFLPAGFVERILDELQVTRIQHGNGAAEDPALVARLARDGVTLDMCPISNLKLRARGLQTMAAHPIRRLLDAGVRVTVSSDDPFVFGNRLSEEYYALHRDLGFSRAELLQVVRNGWRVAEIPESERSLRLGQLGRIAQAHGLPWQP
jgi:adenine deaminase